MSQGKALNKEEVIKSLEPYFKLGYSRNKACICAGIAPQVLQTWVNKSPELLIKIQAWRGLVSATARKNIVKSISEGNELDSKWWLERKEHRTFGRHDKLELEGNQEKPFYVELPRRKVDTTPKTTGSSRKNGI